MLCEGQLLDRRAQKRGVAYKAFEEKVVIVNHGSMIEKMSVLSITRIAKDKLLHCWDLGILAVCSSASA